MNSAVQNRKQKENKQFTFTMFETVHFEDLTSRKKHFFIRCQNRHTPNSIEVYSVFSIVRISRQVPEDLS